MVLQNIMQTRPVETLATLRYEVRGRKCRSFEEATRYAETFAVAPLITEQRLDPDGEGWSHTAFYEADHEGRYFEVAQDYN